MSRLRVDKALLIARLRAGYTQQELSERSGINPMHICHFEKNRQQPRLDNLKKLCVALGVSADEILGISEK